MRTFTITYLANNAHEMVLIDAIDEVNAILKFEREYHLGCLNIVEVFIK